MKYLLPENGSFHKANLHAHTTISDGSFSPEELVKEYQNEGYSILAITDHRSYRYYKEFNTESFVCLAAYEADLNSGSIINPDSFNDIKCYHFNFYDKHPETREENYAAINPPADKYYDKEYINNWLEDMAGNGFLSCYNHPYWSLQDHTDYSWLKNLFAMEIYNHGCEIDGLYGYHPQVYDEMLRSGQKIACVATDDNHNSHPFASPYSDSFGGFTMFKLPTLGYNEVITAMEQGDFYSSMGPEIYDLFVDEGTIHIKCSPVDKIYVLTDGRHAYYKLANPGSYITQASFKLRGNENWLRIDCRDNLGRHANSRAYFKNEWE